MIGLVIIHLSIIIHHYPSLCIVIIIAITASDPELRPDSKKADDGQLGFEHAEIPAGLMLGYQKI